MTAFPTAEDYRVAVQHPARVFTTPELQRAVFATHPLLGTPIPATGTTAVVFRAEVEGRTQALRFFTREDVSGGDRYRALGSHLKKNTLATDVAASAWEDGAVRIGERTWPMVRMEWVEGRTLDRYVGHLIAERDLGALRELARAWRDLVLRMQTDRFAHGDLQHGNVLVDQKGHLRLVDLDSVWIDELASFAPPGESGHHNYQRPRSTWGRQMDTFPGLVIYLTLTALAHNPQPWEVLHNDDNLLFTGEDFVTPLGTPAWKHIAAMHDPALDGLVDQLRAACDPSWTPAENLETVLARAGQPQQSRHDWVAQARIRYEERHGVEAPTVATPRRETSAPRKPSERLRPPPPKPSATTPPHAAPPTRTAASYAPPPRRSGPTTARARAGSGTGSQDTWWQPTSGPGAPGTGGPESATPPSDRRHVKSACIAATVASMIGVLAAVMTAGQGGDPGLAFVATFLCVAVLTYVISLLVFIGRPPPPAP